MDVMPWCFGSYQGTFLNEESVPFKQNEFVIVISKMIVNNCAFQSN